MAKAYFENGTCADADVLVNICFAHTTNCSSLHFFLVSSRVTKVKLLVVIYVFWLES